MSKACTTIESSYCFSKVKDDKVRFRVLRSDCVASAPDWSFWEDADRWIWPALACGVAKRDDYWEANISNFLTGVLGKRGGLSFCGVY